jgi:adenosyl cobinamide kinase/adenosyl cobinamide phosphate guanylyltransferase
VNVCWFKRDLKQICYNYDIESKLTTAHNPQAIAIVEQLHKVVNNIIRSFLDNSNQNLEEKKDNEIDYFLQSAA